jgi:hypothetical protein
LQKVDETTNLAATLQGSSCSSPEEAERGTMIRIATASATVLHTGRLLLTPDALHARPPVARLLNCLQTAGLVGDPLSAAGDRFHCGDRLFDLIGFTGCAVQLPSTTDTENGLEVRLEGPFAAPQLRVGRNSRPPRCPNCQRPLADWRARAYPNGIDKQPVSAHLRCRNCEAENPAWAWQWGRHAGAGSFFVIVEPVFPGEAQPLPSLFEALKRADVGPWHHFYIQD